MTPFEFREQVEVWAEGEQMHVDVARMQAYATAGLHRTKRMPSFSAFMGSSGGTSTRPPPSKVSDSGSSMAMEQRKLDEGRQIFEELNLDYPGKVDGTAPR